MNMLCHSVSYKINPMNIKRCLFGKGESDYQEFENEKIVPVKDRTASCYSSNDFEKFRKNELTKDLDPRIFSGAQYSKESTRNPRALHLQLDFDNQSEELQRYLEFEAQNQSQIRKMNFELDISSR